MYNAIDHEYINGFPFDSARQSQQSTQFKRLEIDEVL